MEKKSINIQLTVKMLTFQLDAKKVSLKGSVFDFKLITILLINLIFYEFENIRWLKKHTQNVCMY